MVTGNNGKRKKRFLSLTLAMFMLLSVFMPMSFADDPAASGPELTENDLKDISASLWFDFVQTAGADGRSVLSGSPITGFLDLMPNLPEDKKFGTVMLDVTIAASAGMKIQQHAGLNDSSVIYTRSGDNELILTIPAFPVGSNKSIPFSAVFQNGITKNGTAGVVYVKEISCGAASYGPDITETDPLAFEGSSEWDFLGNNTFFTTASAISSVDWTYAVDVPSGKGVYKIPAMKEGASGANSGTADPDDKAFGFVFKTSDTFGADEFGKMNIAEARPAAVIEVLSPLDIALEESCFEPDGYTIEKVTVDDKSFFLLSWTEAGFASQPPAFDYGVYIDEFKYLLPVFSGAKIRLTPVVYDANAGAKLVEGTTVDGKPVFFSDSLGYVTAIDGERYPIKADDPEAITVNKAALIKQDETDPSDLSGIAVSKAVETWYYDITSNDVGDGSESTGKQARKNGNTPFVTNDIFFRAPNWGVGSNTTHHGNRIRFNLGFTNTAARGDLAEIRLRETAGSTATAVTDNDASFVDAQMRIIGFDPGQYSNVGSMELEVHVLLSTDVTKVYPISNLTSAPDASYFDLFAKDDTTYTSTTTIKQIEFIYKNVPNTDGAGAMSIAKNPGILFEAVSTQTTNGNFPNKVFLTVKPTEQIGWIDDKGAEIEENDLNKKYTKTVSASVLYLPTYTNTTATKKATGTNMKGDSIIAGDEVTYVITVTNNSALPENIGRVLIKDKMNASAVAAVPDTATVRVKSKQGDKTKTVVPKGETPVDGALSGGIYTYTYTGVPLTKFKDGGTVGNDNLNGLEDGDTFGFFLWLTGDTDTGTSGFEGSFGSGDVIEVEYKVTTLPGLADKNPVKNECKYMLVPTSSPTTAPPEGQEGGTGAGGGNNDNDGHEWSGTGSKTLTVRDKTVTAGITKSTEDITASKPYFVYDENPQEKPGDKLIYENTSADLITYTVTASLTESDMDGTRPVVVDQLPPGFTLPSDWADALNLTVKYYAPGASPVTWAKDMNYTAEEKTDDGNVFLIVKPKNTMPAGSKIDIVFKAEPPIDIEFRKDKTNNKSIVYTNYVFFEPNAENLGSSAVAGTTGVFGAESKGSTIAYTAYGNATAPQTFNAVPNAIVGESDPAGVANAGDRIFLYASSPMQFTKAMPVVSLTKKATTTDGKIVSKNAGAAYNPLFPGVTVRYKSTFKNETIHPFARGEIRFESVVDLLPPGQEFKTGTVTATYKTYNSSGTPVQTGNVTGGDLSTVDGRQRVIFSLPTKIVLAPDEYFTIEYEAQVLSDADAIRKLMIAAKPYANTIAVYPKEPYYKVVVSGNTTKDPAEYHQGDDVYACLDADKATSTYTTADAPVYYDVPRIHPDIDKKAFYSQAGSGTLVEATQGIFVSDGEDKEIIWRISIGNAEAQGHVNETMEAGKYRIVDQLASGVFMDVPARTQFDADYKSQGFDLAYDLDTRTITITGPELAPNEIKTIQYATRVTYGTAIAGSLTNEAYLVPDDVYYFERDDTHCGFTGGDAVSLGGDYATFDSGADKHRAVKDAASVSFSTNIGASAFKFLDVGADAVDDAGIEAFSGDPAVPAERGQRLRYGFELENSSQTNRAFKNVAVIDVLPRENDRYVMSNLGRRESRWAPLLSESPDFTLKVENAAIGSDAYCIYVSVADLAASRISDEDWKETPPDDRWTLIKDYGDLGLNNAWNNNLKNNREAITAIKFYVKGTANAGDPAVGALKKGETFRVTWLMDVPEDIDGAPMDKTAWNSAAYNVQFLTSAGETGDLRNTYWEPEKVGVYPAGGKEGSLTVTKTLLNAELLSPDEFEERSFTFELFNETTGKTMRVKGGGGSGYDYVYTDAAGEGSDTFTIHVDGKSSAVKIGKLPEGHYTVRELGGHAHEYTALPTRYNGPVIDGNAADGVLRDAYVWDRGTASAEIVNISPRPYSLVVRKELLNAAYALNKEFAFELRNGNDVPVKLAETDGMYVYAPTAPESRFTVVADDGGSGYAMISDLPAGNYRVVELTKGYEEAYAYAYIPEGGETENLGSSGITVNIDRPLTTYLVTVTNHVAKPLVVQKIVTNRDYTARTDFEFELRTQDGEAVPLTQAGDGVYRYAANGATDAVERFTVRVPSDKSSAQVTICELPTGEYSVFETTQGYSPTYAYAYHRTGEATPAPAGTSLSVDQKAVDIEYYSASVTNHVSLPGRGEPSTPPVTPPVTPPTTPPVTPPITPPDDGGTTPPDGGGTTTPEGPGTPGGSDPAVPPTPMAPGSSLVPTGNGGFVEIGEDGTPLGEWYWDDGADQWLFDEYPPLGDLPQTGFRVAFAETSRTVYPFICLITLLLLLAVFLPPIADRRAKKRTQRF
jgi:hypothetical protein